MKPIFLIVYSLLFLIADLTIVNAHRVWTIGPPPEYELIETFPDPLKNRHYYVHWEATRKIPLYVNVDGAGDGLSWEETHTLVFEGASRWEAVSTSSMEFDDRGATSSRVASLDGKNVVVWEGNEFALARASITLDVITLEILDVDVIFNNDLEWGPLPLDEKPFFHVAWVATHELGHLLGIAHTEMEANTNIVMHRYYPHAMGLPHQDDMNAITYLYPETDIAQSGTSTSALATEGSNQRKLFRSGTGQVHQLFVTAEPPGTPEKGHIIYRNSTDEGASWSLARWLNHAQGTVQYPCISVRASYVYAVWQQQTGGNWDLLYSYSTNSGNNWLASPITLVSNFSCPSPGPQPVIIASPPSSSFELMVVYRHSSGLSSLRSTSSPVGGNWIGPVAVTGTDQYAQNASLTYRSNNYPPYRLAWDQNNAINYSLYYPDSWATPYDIGNGAYMASNKTNPSIAVTSDSDMDIVWEGTYSGTRSIITNRNLASVYYAFQSPSYHYYKPSVTGHVNGRATVVWHDNSLNVRKAIYDPMYGWYIVGSTIGTNGANASTSVLNPQGGDAKVVWTEGTSSPYTIHLDGTVLNKPIAKEGGESTTLTSFDGRMYRQLILRDNITNAFLAIQLEAPRLATTSGEEVIEFAAVNDTMRYTPQQIFTLLETKPFQLTSRVSAFSMRRMIRAERIGTLASQGRLRVELVNAQNGQVIISFAQFDLIDNGRGITLDDSVRVPVNRTSGQYKLRLAAENLALTAPSRRASVVNIFVGESETQSISKPSGAIPAITALLDNYPNPFNPTTTIRFQIPTSGVVSLNVYNALGQEVATLVNDVRDAGQYEERFDATRLPSGVYIYKLTAGDFTASKKLAVIK